MVVVLQAAQSLFRFDPAANCVKASVAIDSSVLRLGRPPGKSEVARKTDDDHAELQANFGFDCSGPGPQYIEVGLFNAFRRLDRIEARTITSKGAAKRILTRSASRLPLEQR